MILRRYIEQILNLYNYMDGILVTDEKGVAVYCSTFSSDVSLITDAEVLGKHVLDIYPDLNESTSSILRVLASGKPIFNEYQKMRNYKGRDIYAVNTTFPIKDEMDNVIGAVDISRYIDPEYERKSISLQVTGNKEKKGKYYDIDDIITEEPSMIELKRKIRQIAKTDSSVLICGETGSGKELIAQAIHTNSNRSSFPFIAQNCAAIPSNLLESILFGTEKGSYTGAEKRKGLLEEAEGGTVFLDEVNSMEPQIQAKILRAIETRRIRRVGGNQEIVLDVRFISTINEGPAKILKEEKVRSDLFYRLAVVQLFVPPLRDRKKDILVLANYFMKMYNQSMRRNVEGFTEEVESIFLRYGWPGNIRELRNVVESAFNLMTGKIITRLDIPEYIEGQAKETQVREEIRTSLPEKLERYEKELIVEALKAASSLTEAAQFLKISKQNLNYKIDKYQLRSHIGFRFH